jgi:hypothetical protein
MSRDTWTTIFSAPPGEANGTRLYLKRVLRDCGLKCIDIKCEQGDAANEVIETNAGVQVVPLSKDAPHPGKHAPALVERTAGVRNGTGPHFRNIRQRESIGKGNP